MTAKKKDGAGRGDVPQKSSFQRHPALYIFSVIILVIIVVTFVGAPAVSNTAARGSLSFGRYGTTDIAYQPGNYFARQYDAIAQSLRDTGEGANLELQLRLAWREAFNRTVLHTAILEVALASGVAVTENRIDELLAQSPQFQENGRFSPSLYSRLSAQEQSSLRRFYRETQLFDQFVSDVIDGGQVSSAETAFIEEMARSRRSVRIVRFPFSEYPESELIAFARENASIFTTLDLEVITLSTENEAEQIREQATEGGSFSDLARTYSRDVYADQGGSVGRVMAYELERLLQEPSDLDSLLTLDAGRISPILEVVGGWAFYRAVTPAEPLDLEAEESVATIREYVEVYEQGLVQDFVRSRAESFASTAAQTGFDAAAESEDKEVVETEPFSINYGNEPIFARLHSSEIPDLADAAFQERFFEIAFGLRDDEPSEPVVLRDSVIVMQRGETEEAESESLEFVGTFYPFLKQQYVSEGVESAFVDREQLEDNFSQAFSRYVLGNG